VTAWQTRQARDAVGDLVGDMIGVKAKGWGTRREWMQSGGNITVGDMKVSLRRKRGEKRWRGVWCRLRVDQKSRRRRGGGGLRVSILFVTLSRVCSQCKSVTSHHSHHVYSLQSCDHCVLPLPTSAPKTLPNQKPIIHILRLQKEPSSS